MKTNTCHTQANASLKKLVLILAAVTMATGLTGCRLAGRLGGLGGGMGGGMGAGGGPLGGANGGTGGRIAGAPGNTTGGLGRGVNAGLQPGAAAGQVSKGQRSDFEKQVDDAMLILVNSFREQNGMGPLQADPTLCDNAYAWSKQMEGGVGLEHSQDMCGGSAENIAMNGSYDDPQQVAQALMDQWTNSPGHRANLLGGYSTCGLGTVSNGGGTWSTQAFN